MNNPVYTIWKKWHCTKGHEWEEKMDGPRPIGFSFGAGELGPFCPFCLMERLRKILNGIGTIIKSDDRG